MAKLIKCKICGDTEFTEVGELLQCRSCKHKTPKPKENAELLERANNLRFETKSFDEAANLYEEIIRITPDEAEAYWGRVLCRYGIEYVKDSDGRYLPTCHRTLEGSILDDGDYKMAVMKAQRGMSEYYMSEAQTIDEYQKKIKIIAAKEEPYDVFISFKATDEYGRTTEDSLLAQELYYYLTKNLGLKVFFSNITLKDKAGQEYEPIIYAALSSATVMVLVGTRPEYVNATWVKNEWSRYAKMVAEARAQNKSKYIVTALKDMRPEQLPSILASYQAVNLAELGAKEKLCSNIDSLIGDLRVSAQKSTAAATPAFGASDMLSAEAENLCNLGYQQLSLRDFNKANEYFQKAIEKKSNAALAHWGMLLATQGASDDNELADKRFNIKENPYYKLAMQYASGEEKMRFARIDSLVDVSLAREAAVICSGGFEKLQSGDFDAADTLFSNALSIKSEISLAYWGKLLVSQSVRSDEELASRAMDLQNNKLFVSAMRYASPTEQERYNAVLAQISIQIEKNTQAQLERAENFLQSGNVSDYQYAMSYIAEVASVKEDIPAKLYWQFLRIFAGAADDEMLSEIAYPIKDDIFYQRAIKYANPTEAARYQRVADKCQAAFDLKNSVCAVYCNHSDNFVLFTKTERDKYLKNYHGPAIVEVIPRDTVFHIEKQKYYNPEDVLDQYMLKYIAGYAVANRKELLKKDNVSLYMHATSAPGRGLGLEKALGISYKEAEELLAKAPCYIAHNLSLEKARELFITYSKCNVHVCIHSESLDKFIQMSKADEDPNARVCVYLTEIGMLFGGSVRGVLQDLCGIDKAKAKEITKKLPALIAANIPLSDAQKIVDAITSKASKAEIRMQ
ncbi:MAG: toll/interleukin-1 receptor domain-containing protein [Clostridia bacterium]|nr:toll/interleukin-1 receptor domain-containing protein [Clostridia bacterium]